MQADWVAPLPDFSAPAISRRLRIGGLTFTVQISPVQRDTEDEPDTDLIQLQVLYQGRPLAPADLGVPPAACLNLWSYLCNKLTEAVVDFYDPRQRIPGEPNPRLGCWGPRPDLKEAGLAETDCGLAVVMGLSTWTVGARPVGSDRDLLESLAAAIVHSLGYWVLTVERSRARQN